MKVFCSKCGLRFEREPGYWVGAVIINTAVVFGTFVVVFGGLVLTTWPEVPWALVLAVTVLANATIPIALYPISKTIWLALELSWHPLEPDEITAADARAPTDA
jgi:Na+(H+)/acetate symporter ActP